MKTKAPLMVVATLNPETVSGERLARFSTPQGDFVTNAGLEFVFSPYTGKEMKMSEGKRVAATIDEDKAVGVICQSCKSINATNSTTRSEMFCVTCGTHMKYDLASEGLEDEEVEQILDEAEFDDKDMIGGDDLETDDEDLDLDEEASDELEEDVVNQETSKKSCKSKEMAEGEEDFSDEESEEDAGPLDDYMQEVDAESEGEDDESVVEMTEVVDEDEEVEFVDTEASVIAMVSGHVVASMPSEHENAGRVLSTAFKNGFRHTVSAQGLNKALVSAGFKVKKILVKDVVKAATKRAQKTVAREVAAKQALNAKRFAECLEIATAGGMVGMFAKEKANILTEELAKVLASMNVSNPRKVAKTVLSKALAQHNKAIINIATDLMKREDSILSAYKEQIAGMVGHIASEEVEDEDEDEVEVKPDVDNIESRLTSPMRETKRSIQTASTQKSQPKNPLVKGLFSTFF